MALRGSWWVYYWSWISWKNLHCVPYFPFRDVVCPLGVCVEGRSRGDALLGVFREPPSVSTFHGNFISFLLWSMFSKDLEFDPFDHKMLYQHLSLLFSSFSPSPLSRFGDSIKVSTIGLHEIVTVRASYGTLRRVMEVGWLLASLMLNVCLLVYQLLSWCWRLFCLLVFRFTMPLSAFSGAVRGLSRLPFWASPNCGFIRKFSN